MTFTSIDYFVFFVIVFTLYWQSRNKTLQNLIVLVASYIFYGWVHPWFCILLVTSTVADYFCGIAMVRYESRKRLFLVISLLVNLGLLCGFKYFNFFVENVHAVLSAAGLSPGEITLQIFLPVGISFYTFQTLSYTIDIYEGKLKPTHNFIDFACFVAMFPQLVAGPIERAAHMLPQLEKRRYWNFDLLFDAWPLMIRGYLKKMVIADNVAVYVDQIFMLESPSFLMLTCGGLAFALQIYADFSAYTDIARASSRMFGIELMENFKSPYLAISPSDFWRRWHISFSTWIRDYLYIPLGGSKVSSTGQFLFVVLTTMGLAGLWHGAAWHFVWWGIFHGTLTFIYHKLGMGGRWMPKTKPGLVVAWAVMFSFTIFGWLLFRTTDMGWIFHALGTSFDGGFARDQVVATVQILTMVGLYMSPLIVLMALDRGLPRARMLHTLFYGAAIVAIIVFHRDQFDDFIYFQF